MRSWIKENAAVLGVTGLQLLLAAALNLASPALDFHDDSVTFFTQGMMLWLGSFPPDPNRPLLYPFFLSLGLRLFGLDLVGIRWFQVLLLGLTTLLLYRLARITLGKRAALLASALYVLFPAGIIQANEFYRESVTPFFFILTLNLVQSMLAGPEKPARAFFAGIAAGLLVMLKPEFGTMMGVLALAGLVAAIRGRQWKEHLLPWLICGASAFLAITPLVLTDRAAYQEWIFVCTNTGKYFAVSYCGDLETGKPEDRNQDFFAKDNDRFGRTNPLVNRVFFASDPSIPFGERDRWLLRRARECVAKNPSQALDMVVHRGLGALFLIVMDHVWMVTGGQFKINWPAPAVQGLTLLTFLIQFFVLIFLFPGLWRLGRTAPGRAAALAFLWAVIFYALSFFRTRLIFAVYTVFLMAGVAGLGEVGTWIKTRSRLCYVFAVWVIAGSLGFGLVSRPWRLSVFKAANWGEVKLGTGAADSDKLGAVLIMAQIMLETNHHSLLPTELHDFLRVRKDSWSPAILLQAGDAFLDKNQFTAAGFFYRVVLEFYGPREEASAKQRQIESRKRVVRLGEWTKVKTDAADGRILYSAKLPAPAAADPDFPDPGIKLHGASGEFAYNRELLTTTTPAAKQFFLREGDIWISLTPDLAPPTPAAPLSLDYFSAGL